MIRPYRSMYTAQSEKPADQIAGGIKHTCDQCGKEFTVYCAREMWHYQMNVMQGRVKKHYFCCSYKCIRQVEREHEKKKTVDD